MITDNADLLTMDGTELGWGFSSITKGFKKIGSGVASVGKGVAKGVSKVGRGVVGPGGWAARYALKKGAQAGKGVAKVGYKVGKTAAKTGYRAGKFGVKTGYKTGKFAVKQAARIPKALADLALYPVRKSLRTLKNRRAELLAFKARGTKQPTVAEKAQARKDVKAMLSKKGPHGKMLAYLAGGGPMLAGELGVVGYDDAALAAVATALLASLRSIMSSAAKGKFAPVDAAKAGIESGASVGFQQLVDTSAGQKVGAGYRALEERTVAPTAAASRYATAYSQFVDEAAAKAAAAPEEAAEYLEERAPYVTPEEVAAEPEIEAEEAAIEAETEEFAGMLAGAGLLNGFMEAVPAAAAPSAMPEKTARRIAFASQRVLCQMSTPALIAIGGIHAPQVASALCQGLAVGDEASMRAALPGAVQIAARVSADLARQVGVGGLPNDGFGALAAADLDEIGMLAAFDEADPEELAYGLAGVSLADFQAAESGSAWVFLPVGLAALAGLLLLRK